MRQTQTSRYFAAINFQGRASLIKARRLIVPNQKPAQGRFAGTDALARKSVTKLQQCPIPVLPEPGRDQIGISFSLLGTADTTERSRPNASLPDVHVSPTAHTGRVHPETIGGLPVRKSTESAFGSNELSDEL